MPIIYLHDKQAIATFLHHDPWMHLYAIGDLDDFFWPYTTWYALQEHGQIQQLALQYTGTDLPVILAISREPEQMRRLVASALHLLPGRLHSHLSEGVVEAFADRYRIEPHGMYYKMALTNPDRLAEIDTTGTVRLTTSDRAIIETLYRISYPDNWFDPRMLETGQYYGMLQNGTLIGAAGIHVYSPEYRVAALGNITTHPQARGQGVATAVTARLCQSLLEHVDQIGLNVRIDNVSAVTCYRKLGFEPIATYGEYMLTLR